MIGSQVENSYRLKRAATLTSVAVLTAVLFMTVGGFFGVGSLSPMASMLQPAYATVEPQQHGIGMLADCVKVQTGDTNDCTFSVRNDDDFLDSMVLESVQATFLAPFPGAPVTHVFPAGGAMVITGVTGYVPDGVDDCEAGGTLPCEIPPTGRVFFADTSFTMTTAGSFPYNTQASATDQCDGAPSDSCSTDTGGQAALALVTQTVADADMELTKTPDVEKAQPGDTINYTIELANTGSSDIPISDVSDPLLGGSLGPADSGDDVDAGVLNVGETWQWIRAYEVTEQDCGDLDNTATATAEFQLTPIERSASATVFIACPDMELTKLADTEEAVPGDTITYTIELSNTGNADIANPSVSDPLLGGDLGPADSGDDVDAGVLNVGETWTWTRTHTATVDDCPEIINTATATGEFQLTPLTRTATETVSVDCPVTPADAWITGGGIVFPSVDTMPDGDPDWSTRKGGPGTYALTHGFELHCDPAEVPNNVTFNFPHGKTGKSMSFKLERLDEALCVDSWTTSPIPPPPGPDEDTYYGAGKGRFFETGKGIKGNEGCGAAAYWTFTDGDGINATEGTRGEPGKFDRIVTLHIEDKNGNVILEWQGTVKYKDADGNPTTDEIGYFLRTGNHQFHIHQHTHTSPNNLTPCTGATLGDVFSHPDI